MDKLSDYLAAHRFTELFRNELGWDRASATLNVDAGRRQLTLEAVAQKRGFHVFHCRVSRQLLQLSVLRRVQRRIARSLSEHVLICSCDRPAEQFWKWAIRPRRDRRLRHYEHAFFSRDPPAPFLSLLSALRFSNDQPRSATVAEVPRRVRAALEAARDNDRAADRPRASAVAPAAADGGAIHELVLNNRRLARQCSNWLVREFGMDADDAEQIGVMGLIKAARRFHPERGVEFGAYANFWVREECHRIGRRWMSLIRVPENVDAALVPLRRRLEQLTLQSGPGRADEELLRLCLADELFFRRWLGFERALNVRSLSDRREPEYREARNLVAPSSDPFEDEEPQQRVAALHAAIDALEAREGRLLRMRYGIDGAPRTLQQIGAAEGITRERVRQIVARAEKRLRRLLTSQATDPGAEQRNERRENLVWLGQFAGLPLNDCQRAALLELRRRPWLSFREYQRLNHADQFTARRELCGLERSGVIERIHVDDHCLYRLKRAAANTGVTDPDEQTILTFIRERGSATIAECRQLAAVRRPHPGRVLRKLARSGILREFGQKRNSIRYVLA